MGDQANRGEDVMAASVEMPRYQCHKKVWALQIVDVLLPKAAADGEEQAGPRLAFSEPYSSLGVTADFIEKHNPQPGGYYVVYDDGYRSYSPRKAFEDGYTRL